MTENLTKVRDPHRPAGVPSPRAHEKRTVFENDLLPLMALLGVVYGWVLAFLTGAVALIVILAG